MSKRDEKITHYLEVIKKLELDLTDELITKVTVGLGPSIYKKNAELVSCSSKEELDKIKTNFLIKKLGLPNDEKLDTAIKNACKAMGSSNRQKYRPIFYALLVKELKKEDIYA
ncbi:MAG: DUF2853 family protein [Sulfurovum sp.]